MLKSAGRFLLYLYENEFHQTVFLTETDYSDIKDTWYAHGRYFLASVSPNNNFNEKVADLLACFPLIDRP